MPVHDAADCRAQQCHAHRAPLVPREAPRPANDLDHPPHDHRGPLVPRDAPHPDDQED